MRQKLYTLKHIIYCANSPAHTQARNIGKNIGAVFIDETMLVTRPEELPDSALKMDRDFLANHLELHFESDGWMALEATLSAAIRLAVCNECGGSVVDSENITCGGKCKLRYHQACVKIVRRRKYGSVRMIVLRTDPYFPDKF